MKFARLLRIVFLILLVAAPAMAVDTAFWQVGSFEEFLQGTLTGLAMSREGDVRLAPQAQAIFNPEEALALSLARDSQGNVYVGTGHQGKVFRVTPDQKSSTVFSAREPDIFALAAGPDGNLYVGSSPDGKVYKVTPDGKSSIFYDPKAKSIWALQFDSQGRLYVGTGDKGQIFRVDPSGKGEVFFDSKQTHIMCLSLDHQGNLLAGSVPDGLIYRLTPEGKAFVLYQTGLPEVHDLAVDEQGHIFAAALGGSENKGTPEMLLAPQNAQSAPVATVTVTASSDSESTARGQLPPGAAKTPSFNRSAPQLSSAFPMHMGGGHGALIEIFPDSNVETIWSSNNESIFGLALRNHHVLFTTDNNGRIFQLDSQPTGDNLSIITETHESLATRLLVGGGNLYAATSNVAKLFRVETAPTSEGTLESAVKDTKFVSHWGTLVWRGDVPAGCTMQFYTRSGNSERPDSTWSEWSGPYSDPEGDSISSPPARYIQWKAVLRSNGGASPTLDDVTVAYLNQNLPPQIHSINVSASIERLGLAAVANSSSIAGAINISAPVSYNGPAQATGSGRVPITLAWQADDPNGDQIVYSLYLKAADEREWHLMKDKIHQPTYTIDPASLPDGKYVAKLVASDEESNPPALARTSELLSAPFWVDNTPPAVNVAKQTVTGTSADVQFSAEDSTSPLRGAETTLDGQPWRSILSDDGIVDSRSETFTVKLTNLIPGEHVLVLRAADTSGNIGVGKAIIHISGSGSSSER